MGADTLETCMQELEFQILDQDEKVTVVQFANTWSISVVEATSRLDAFVKKHEKDELFREYLVRGTVKDRAIVTVVPESKVQAYQKKLDGFSKTLFGVAKKFPSNETLNYKLEPTQVITLPLDVGQRPVKVHIIPEARPAMEKEKKKNVFAMPGNKKPMKVEEKQKVSPKKEPTTPKKDDKVVSPSSSPVKASSSSSSVKKGSEKTAKGKPVAKTQMGKGSIASFFGQKSGSSNVEKQSTSPPEDRKVKSDTSSKQAAAEKEEKKTPKAEPEATKTKTKIASPAEDSTRKRNLSSDRGSESDKKKKQDKSADEPSTKKAKKEVKTKKVEKRSRIMAICDSESSDEEKVVEKEKQEVEDKKQRKQKKKVVDSDEDEVMEVEVDEAKSSKEEPKKTNVSPDENKNPDGKKRRFKATRKVTKSYQDEDGFIRTVREIEEYSCSDDEVVEVKQESKGKGSPIKDSGKSSTVSSQKARVPSKQGSIMSFFGKK